jgi:hypothetical protein
VLKAIVDQVDKLEQPGYTNENFTAVRKYAFYLAPFCFTYSWTE